MVSTISTTATAGSRCALSPPACCPPPHSSPTALDCLLACIRAPGAYLCLPASACASPSPSLRRPALTPTSFARQSMLNHADKTGNGGVSMDDFYRLMKKQQGNKLDDLLGDDE